MKFNALFLLGCLSFTSVAMALDANQHIFQAPTNADPQQAKNNLKWPGYCEIEIINQSYDDIYVSGARDDGAPLYPFSIYAFEYSHYISLYDYDWSYCHAWMRLDIDSLTTGRHIFSGYVRNQSTVKVVQWLNQQAHAEIKTKA